MAATWAMRSALLLIIVTTLIGNIPGASSCPTVRSVRVVEGQSAELYCHINNLPNNPPYYMKSWSKTIRSEFGNSGLLVYRIIRAGATHTDTVGQNYTGRVVNVTDDVIKLLNVTQQDTGQYYCVLDSDIDGCINTEVSFTMTVIVPVSNVELSVKSAKQGAHVTFRCTCTVNGTTPITYTWQKVAGSLPGGGRWQGGSDGSVTLSNVQRSDAGRYTCTADNEANRPVISNQVYFDIYYAPSQLVLTSSPSDLTHRVTDNIQVALTCSAAGGHPTPDVSLYRGNIRVTSGTSQVTLRRRLQKSDNQVAFVCRATSKGISGEMSSNQIIYNVTYPHTVTVHIQNTPVIEGGHVTLTCDAAGGNPQHVLSYEWRHTSEFTSDRGELAAKKQLILTEVSYRDAGKYECHVPNSGGTASDVKYLTVLYTAKLDPRIRNHQLEKHSDYGADVTFTLKVIANPQPTFNWTYTNQRGRELLLPKASVSNSFLQSSLTIHNVAVEDFTMYTCVVTNSVGQSLFHFKLTIAVAPETPVSFKIDYKSVTTVTLTWISSFSGGYPQTFQIVYRKTGDPWPVKPQIQNIDDPGEGSEVTYKLTGLHPGTSYEFHVKAVNSRSSGPNSSDFTSVLNTTTNEMPSVTEFSVLREPQSVEAEASWSVDRGRFTHLVIQICESSCRHKTLSALEAANQKTVITGLEPDKKYTYKLMLYDNGDLIQETRGVNSRDLSVGGNSRTCSCGVSAGVFGGVVGLLIAVIVVLVVLLIKMQREKSGIHCSMGNCMRKPRDVIIKPSGSPDHMTSAEVTYQNSEIFIGLNNTVSQATAASDPPNEYEKIRILGSNLTDAQADYQNIPVRTHAQGSNADHTYQTINSSSENEAAPSSQQIREAGSTLYEEIGSAAR